MKDTNEAQDKIEYCKRLVYTDDLGRPSRLLGKVISQKDGFIEFLTGAGKTYLISIKSMISLTPTDKKFVMQQDTGGKNGEV